MGWEPYRFAMNPTLEELPSSFDDLRSSGTRIDAILGRTYINAGAGCYESGIAGAWIPPLPTDNTTPCQDTINRMINEAAARSIASGSVAYDVFLPPTHSYVVSDSILKKNRVGIIGNGTKIVGAATITNPVIDFVEDHGRIKSASENYPALQRSLFGLYLDTSASHNDLYEGIIRAKNVMMLGQLMENINVEGYASNPQTGIRVSGHGSKYHNTFRNIHFYRCKSPYGALHFGAENVTQANNNCFEFINTAVCWISVMAVNGNPMSFRHCNFNPSVAELDYVTPTVMATTNGLITSGKYPRVWLHNAFAQFSDSYFDSLGAEVAILHTTNAASTYLYTPIKVSNCIGITSPNQVKMVSNGSIWTKILNGVTYVNSTTFTLWNDMTSTFAPGNTIYLYDGSSWSTCTVGSSSYPTDGKYITTVVLSSGTVTANLERVSKSAEQSCVYSSSTVVTPQSGGSYAKTKYQKGRRLFFISQDGTWRETNSNSYIAGTLTVADAVIPATVHSNYQDRLYPIPILEGINDYGRSVPKVNTTATCDYPALYIGEGKIQSFTMTKNIVVNHPEDLSPSEHCRFTLLFDGTAAGADYSVCWNRDMYARLSVVPDGWTATVDMYWDGSSAYAVNEKLIKAGSVTWDVPNMTNPGDFFENDVVFAGLLPTDKVRAGSSGLLLTTKAHVSGRVVYKAGVSNVRLRVTNRDTIQVNPTSGAYWFVIERAVFSQEESGKACTAEVEISNAEVKALIAAPITLIPTPGAGKWIEVLGATLIHDYATAAFTESADNMVIEYASGVAITAAITASGFVTTTADTAIKILPAGIAATALTNLVNNAIRLRNTGDNEYATGGGVLRILINYLIHDDTVPST